MLHTLVLQPMRFRPVWKEHIFVKGTISRESWNEIYSYTWNRMRRMVNLSPVVRLEKAWHSSTGQLFISLTDTPGVLNYQNNDDLCVVEEEPN